MSQHLIIPIEICPGGEGLDLPSYGTPDSSGMDLRAAITENILLEPFARCLVPCGFSMKIPSGFEAQIRSRSGLALNHGVSVLNSPGTIDADYRGEIKVILINLGSESFEITRGMRCAQMVIAPIQRAELVLMPTIQDLDDYENNKRQAKGFGSTGVH